MIYFVDTSAFYASKDPSDKNSQKAKGFLEQIKNDLTSKLITSNFVLDETITLIRMKLGHDAAVRFKQQILKSDITEVIYISEKIETNAWMIFKKYKDKDFSYTDCTSFAIMEELGLTHAFAFDKHFMQYGFIVVP